MGCGAGFGRGVVDMIRGSFSICSRSRSKVRPSTGSTGLPALKIYGASKVFRLRPGDKKCGKIRKFRKATSGFADNVDECKRKTDRAKNPA